MIKIADNIISPLGNGSEENFQALLCGRSKLRRYEGAMGLPDPFVASLIEDYEPREGYTKFESLLIDSISGALAQVPDFDPASERVLWVISSTKGNVGMLDEGDKTNQNIPAERVNLGVAATAVAKYFGNGNNVIAVSNACISGLSAQICAMRALESGDYDYAIVAGCDVQSRFIISGFQSFYALSPEECRPFDIDRQGLNLGEAAATIIYAADKAFEKNNTPGILEKNNTPEILEKNNTPGNFRNNDTQETFANNGTEETFGKKDIGDNSRESDITGAYKAIERLGESHAATKSIRVWRTLGGAIRNDANHISNPVRTGEGSLRALRVAKGNLKAEDFGLVSVHGTSTLFNDEMESVAIHRAELSSVPINSLKGYYGHTMGAAGILETIISMKEIEHHTILATRGYKELGVSKKVNISCDNRPTDKWRFIKLLSGFGGCNAALSFEYTVIDEGRESSRTLTSEKQSDGNNSQLSTFRLSEGRESSLSLPSVRKVGRRPILKSQIASYSDNSIEKGFVQQGNNCQLSIVNCQFANRASGLLYRRLGISYPKFYKMDALSRMGFIAVEMLLSKVADRHSFGEQTAVILFGRTGSIWDDRKYQKIIGSIADSPVCEQNLRDNQASQSGSSLSENQALQSRASSSENQALPSGASSEENRNFFPSPAVFVYTLPNIVTGEIAIRNKYFGETSFYLLDHYDEAAMDRVVRQAFLDPCTKEVITGWLDYESDDNNLCKMRIVRKND